MVFIESGSDVEIDGARFIDNYSNKYELISGMITLIVLDNELKIKNTLF